MLLQNLRIDNNRLFKVKACHFDIPLQLTMTFGNDKANHLSISVTTAKVGDAAADDSIKLHEETLAKFMQPEGADGVLGFRVKVATCLVVIA